MLFVRVIFTITIDFTSYYCIIDVSLSLSLLIDVALLIGCIPSKRNVSKSRGKTNVSLPSSVPILDCTY